MELLVATRNPGKVREFRKALRGLGFRIRSLRDFGDVPEMEEDGRTFVENALKKARFYSKAFNLLTVSDDSGLVVDSLDGRPGIRSARFAGDEATDQDNNRKLLALMEDVSPSGRAARFRCAIAIASPRGKEGTVEGECRGRIGFREVGKKGFGYDPLFILPRLKKTVAQLGLEEKNRVSHRGKALKKLQKVIRKFM